jgi:hypothetical protein
MLHSGLYFSEIKKLFKYFLPLQSSMIQDSPRVHQRDEEIVMEGMEGMEENASSTTFLQCLPMNLK